MNYQSKTSLIESSATEISLNTANASDTAGYFKKTDLLIGTNGTNNNFGCLEINNGWYSRS